jgi:hypothetical protein
VPFCTTKFANNSTATVTINAPAAWTVSLGSGGTAGSTAALLAGQNAIMFVDPITASNIAIDVVEQGITCSTGMTCTRGASGLTLLAAGSPNLYTEAAFPSTTAASNTVAVPIYTGYTLPVSKLTAGHRIVVKACFKHSTGATSTTYNWSFGGVSTTLIATSTVVTPICSTMEITSVDSTHEQLTLFTNSSSNTTPIEAALTNNLASTNAINVTQTAAGTSDVYTAYTLSVDLY